MIIYFINFLKKNLTLGRLHFIYFSIVGWLLIILVSSIPLFELMSYSNFNEIIFYTTSQVTNSGFDINTKNINTKIILSLWTAFIQNIGALYTLLLFIIYSNVFLNKNFLVVSKTNIIKLYFIYLFLLSLYLLIFFSKNFFFIFSSSLASTIISSTGFKVFNSVFLNVDTNYYIITLMMLISLLILPILLIVNTKKPFQSSYVLILKNKFNIFFFIFLTLFLF